MFNAQALANAFAELDDLVASEPQLCAFAEATKTLREQAAGLARGDLNISPLGTRNSQRIPSRSHAVSISNIVAKMFGPDESEDRALRLAVARLMGNLVDGS